MKPRFALPLAALVVLAAAAGCGKKTETTNTNTNAAESTVTAAPPAATAPDTTKTAAPSSLPVAPATPPQHIEVQHVLIGFQGSIPNKTITRTKAEAEKLANEILDRARKGESMDALCEKYTDDQCPGIYDLANTGVTPRSDPNNPEYPRTGMVKGFSDAAFGLSVGNVGISSYDPKNSPYGWHIIKRIK
jgi:hypothetical protein